MKAFQKTFFVFFCILFIVALAAISSRYGKSLFNSLVRHVATKPNFPNLYFDQHHSPRKAWFFEFPQKYSNKRLDEKTALRTFKMEDVVDCLDVLSRRKNGSIHIAFLGDSLIRIQFDNLRKFIPDYDQRETEVAGPDDDVHYYGVDRNYSSPLLHNFLLSFRWRRLIHERLLEDLKTWSLSSDSQVPDFIFLGVTAHHMLPIHKQNSVNETFQRLVVKDLLPLLKTSLINHPDQRIIWISQNPTTDILAPVHNHETNLNVHARKISHYNQIIRNIFRETGVIIWDSHHLAIEDYIRGCALSDFSRRDFTGYYKCGDFIHPGRVILDLTSQLIFNYVCNIQ